MILLFMLFVLLIIGFAVISYSIHRDIRNKGNELILRKAEAQINQLKIEEATKLTYGEQQRLNFGMGRHWL
jgi:hypothetical protein